MRLGSISFINSLPVDLGITSGAVPFRGQTVPGDPAALNDAMLAGSVDAGPVSALWYGLHARDLVLLPDLAIGSRSGVRSVLLFARAPLRELGGSTRIAVTAQGKTTPVLLEILCRARYGFKPDTEVVPERLAGVPEGFDAALVIGDDALVLGTSRARTEGLHVTDLGEEWRAWTGTPAVFAVWVARRAFFETRPGEVAAAIEALARSRRWAAENPAAVVDEAARRTGLPRPVLEGYFSALSYDFDEPMKRGLKLYFEHAARLGFVPAVPSLETVRPSPSALPAGASTPKDRP